MKNKCKLILSICFFLSFTLYGQERTITGSVTDIQNESLPGVTIQVKNSHTGTITGMDGEFSIQVPDDHAVLIFSFIGYKTQELPINGKQILKIKMQEDTQMIDEVVVVGFGTQKKSTSQEPFLR